MLRNEKKTKLLHPNNKAKQIFNSLLQKEMK